MRPRSRPRRPAAAWASAHALQERVPRSAAAGPPTQPRPEAVDAALGKARDEVAVTLRDVDAAVAQDLGDLVERDPILNHPGRRRVAPSVESDLVAPLRRDLGARCTGSASRGQSGVEDTEREARRRAEVLKVAGAAVGHKGAGWGGGCPTGGGWVGLRRWSAVACGATSRIRSPWSS